MTNSRVLALLVCLCCQLPAAAQAPGLLKGVKRIVFLGDSNTFAGGFIAYLDTFLVTRFPERKYELINLGLPSETVSGLSEPDHPYPRPNLHTRLDKALDLTKPDLVVACYGMNDGIYSPFSDERFKKYQEGIERLRDKVKKAKAKIVLLTPAPFDAVPVKKNLLGKEAAKHSWMKPYEGYDAVLRKYSDWLLTLRGQGVPVGDPHAAVHKFLAQVRKTEASYTVSADGIHPNATGHGIIFWELWKALQLPGEIDRLGDLVSDAKAATTLNHQLPWKAKRFMPLDGRWDQRWVKEEKIAGQLNRLVFGVLGQSKDRWALTIGAQKVGTFSREELKQGVDLSSLPAAADNDLVKLAELVHERQKLLGLAWLTHVGHNRPDTPKGIPLADARKQAEELDRRIGQLNRARILTVRVERIK